MTFSMFIGICTIVGTVVGIVSLALSLADRAKKK